MGRTKRRLAVVGVTALLMLMAVLPMVIGYFQDRVALWVPVSGEFPSVELDFEKDIPSLGLMALSAYGRNWNPIDTENATMTLEEAAQTAKDALEPYRAAGFLDAQIPLEINYIETVSVSIPLGNLSAIFWQISLSSQRKNGALTEANLLIDDATGLVTRVHISREVPVTKWELEDRLDDLARVFFGQLGIEEYASAEVHDLQELYEGDNSAARQYRFEDSQYGEVTIHLILYPYGLYTSYYG